MNYVECRRLIPDFPEYEISTSGKVYSLKYGKCVELRPGLNSAGYLNVNLYKDKKRKTFTVHQLVRKAFLSEHKCTEINHLNGVKTDNRLCNLQPVTRTENLQHAWDTGLRPRTHVRGSAHGNWRPDSRRSKAASR